MILLYENSRSGKKSILAIALLAIIIVLFILVSSCSTTGNKEAHIFEDDPVVAYAHDVFYWEDGISQPDIEYLLSVQNHYISKYLAILDPTDSGKPDRIKKAIYQNVSDVVLANGLYIDWLIQQAGGNNLSQDSLTNNSVRWYYISRIQSDPLPITSDGILTKGIDINIAKSLQLEGVDIFEVVPAASANSDSIDQCVAAGVPVPDKLFDSEWESLGFLGQLIGNVASNNELHIYTSDEPLGVCLALTRTFEPGAERGHIDLICMGQESSNACFFETEGFDNKVQGVVDIDDLYAGENIPLSNDTAAPCTRCHIGENPYIIHPQDPVFMDALAAKSSDLGTDLTWNPINYYEPAGVSSWPANPPPLDLWKIPSDKKCSDCHVSLYAGLFPDVPQMSDPTEYLYCKFVVEKVLEGSGSFPPTMPLGQLSNTADFAGHNNFLLAMCAEPDEGVLVDNTFEDDPSVVSPPHIVTPLYQCAEAVYVDAFLDDAEVELQINNIVVGSIIPAHVPGPIEFSNFGQLKENDVVQARQRVNGVWSDFNEIQVRNFKSDYPTGLPTPLIEPATIFATSSIMSVRYDIPGFNVEVKVNGQDPVTDLTFPGHAFIKPGKTPFDVGDEFTAQVSACGEESPISDPVEAQRASRDDLTEAQINPVSLYESQQFLSILNLTYGSNSEILESGAGNLGGFSTPLSWSFIRIDTPLTLTDELAVRQELSSFTTQPPFSQSPTVLNCSVLPAPEIKDPLPSENFVHVLEPLLGATVRIYDEDNNELGDGTGSVIDLNRALTEGEFIFVIQQIGDCISGQAFQIEV